ncbi:hypothetical protein IHE45_15G008200 [Dioscorea alata]|uniref:Uncharacterized protein n=2 Tax=Dioscorea alata TaxID=55571 RepID=A0ACB7UJI0_DIOAL|nr:hypothetical protein IHE45_15G008200 [Dioscorea alata]KAH7660666.1 hypothetical protein IHE45_15G008200 [Dioscorea alata]
MAKPEGSMEKIKEFINSQINDEKNWAVNMKLLRAFAFFGGSILVMRNFGDLMAI